MHITQIHKYVYKCIYMCIYTSHFHNEKKNIHNYYDPYFVTVPCDHMVFIAIFSLLFFLCFHCFQQVPKLVWSFTWCNHINLSFLNNSRPVWTENNSFTTTLITGHGKILKDPPQEITHIPGIILLISLVEQQSIFHLYSG